ncbi:hypothetical protein K493DRAFT_355176 [Basidiobolus meristosporus CBS 931.73]|uniref:Uncharacterized protein n=1 Tax=Basidiobolus meristosporus CBS 931.73 TaxID=1314790 RepID=A0A1Y1Y2I1_9FUNG|nr:hypothetical protein K493DRAFT_355176 [Basidiobolus meristosporus CBS 931.73]|eukprot:ORX91824.1 hypothetical protein K493DRAFT_355176 [Basidiobolus meristosporus CBS 931.73]
MALINADRVLDTVTPYLPELSRDGYLSTIAMALGSQIVSTIIAVVGLYGVLKRRPAILTTYLVFIGLTVVLHIATLIAYMTNHFCYRHSIKETDMIQKLRFPSSHTSPRLNI